MESNTQFQQKISDDFAAWARESVGSRADRQHSLREFDIESWRYLSERGIWRIAVPAELGGENNTWWDFIAAFQGVARGGRDLGFCLSMVAQAGLIRALVRQGTPEQQKTWLPGLLNGQVSSMALTEESGGSDISKMAVTTGPHDALLSGTKVHITNAPVADVILVLGRSGDLEPKANATLFMVDASDPRLLRGPAETMLGNHTSPTGRLDFDGVPIAPVNVLGEPGNGLHLIHEIIAFDRLLYGMLATAYLDPLIDDLLNFVHERRAFHAVLADHQYVQGRITDIKFAVESTRGISRSAMEAVMSGSADASLLCSIAKYQAAESLRTGTENALRIFGHSGYEEGWVSRSVRDALGAVIAGGTAEMQKKNAFTQMVALR
ncbi:acyl-CoA dehydrogenase family protein [Nocardiopsis salina]|uniref:acyl-CoA dehydrogenase family protein n=1 Tax=Nocardiopsis salina TaxID=245836 RepID=UPI000476AC68|nr:acyl-CoA dehydrogenase family protein [Nocardiopsis salina]